ncbi:hypothetical protein PG985_009649 [Apiospora marii]|uniref:uncharacterized protein n=1 Tax=Apiospora marii TaxID=335849 RepID=UPI00312D124D
MSLSHVVPVYITVTPTPATITITRATVTITATPTGEAPVGPAGSPSWWQYQYNISGTLQQYVAHELDEIKDQHGQQQEQIARLEEMIRQQKKRFVPPRSEPEPPSEAEAKKQ